MCVFFMDGWKQRGNLIGQLILINKLSKETCFLDSTAPQIQATPEALKRHKLSFTDDRNIDMCVFFMEEEDGNNEAI